MSPDPPLARPGSNDVLPSEKSRRPEFTAAPKAWTHEDIASDSLERGDYEEFAWSIIEGIAEALDDKKIASPFESVTRGRCGFSHFASSC